MGGSERQAMRLAEALSAQGIEVIVLTRMFRGLAPRENLGEMRIVRPASLWDLGYRLSAFCNKAAGRFARGKGAPTEADRKFGKRVGWDGLLHGFILYRNAIRYLRSHRGRIDVLQTHTIEWVVLVAAAISRATGIPALAKDSTMNGVEKMRLMPFGRRLQRFAIAHAHFVAMTAAIESNMRAQGIPAGRVHRIPNGIRLDEAPNPRPAFRPAAIFIGNLYQQPAKGVDVLFAAWPAVVARFPLARLDVVGDGAHDSHRLELARLGIESSVRLLGKRSDIANCLDSADVFVLPSRREGMSNALMEAMARGMPCVATDISGNQDLIENGISGLLVPPEDPVRLSEAIVALFMEEDAAIRMGARARERVFGLCELGNVAHRYGDLYRSLARHREPEPTKDGGRSP
jgi:glycosyltransferase involved in cell wall biosynthesis